LRNIIPAARKPKNFFPHRWVVASVRVLMPTAIKTALENLAQSSSLKFKRQDLLLNGNKQHNASEMGLLGDVLMYVLTKSSALKYISWFTPPEKRSLSAEPPDW